MEKSNMQSLCKLAAISVACLLLTDCQISPSQKLEAHRSADLKFAEFRARQLTSYMTCLGFTPEAADQAIRATNGDEQKVLAGVHAILTRDAPGVTQLSRREIACRKSNKLSWVDDSLKFPLYMDSASNRGLSESARGSVSNDDAR
jgi:hypothetical protein